MIKLRPPFRPATADDSAVLALLVNEAGEGLPEYLWSRMAGQGEYAGIDDPWQVGRLRQAAMARAGKVIVLDSAGGPVAALTGYPIPANPEPVSDDMPALFRPLQELENLAPSTWYVNVLAASPQHRGQGYGSRLLDLAGEIAVSEHLDGLSLIVANNNIGAQRLYGRAGFREKARRAMVRENWRTEGREWILLVKHI